MGERRGRTWGRVLVAAAMSAAVPAGAQPGELDLGLDRDTLGVAADAVPLEMERLELQCHPPGLRVIRDAAEYRAIRDHVGCGASGFPEIGRALYVHVEMGGDCRARHRVRAFRSDSRREFRVVMASRQGGSRAACTERYWLRLPPLPEGWTVGFTGRRLEDDELGEPLEW